jgi:hypothetical protein
MISGNLGTDLRMASFMSALASTQTLPHGRLKICAAVIANKALVWCTHDRGDEFIIKGRFISTKQSLFSMKQNNTYAYGKQYPDRLYRHQRILKPA